MSDYEWEQRILDEARMIKAADEARRQTRHMMIQAREDGIREVVLWLNKNSHEYKRKHLGSAIEDLFL